MKNINFCLFILVLVAIGKAHSQTNLLEGKWKNYRIADRNGIDTNQAGEPFATYSKWEFTKTYFFNYWPDGFYTKIEYQLTNDTLHYLKAPHYKVEKISETELLFISIEKYPKWHYFKRVENFDEKVD